MRGLEMFQYKYAKRNFRIEYRIENTEFRVRIKNEEDRESFRDLRTTSTHNDQRTQKIEDMWTSSKDPSKGVTLQWYQHPASLWHHVSQ
jgi:hypothetical protein